MHSKCSISSTGRVIGSIMSKKSETLDSDEIKRRMNAGVRRALNTPPSPTKELIGKTERAQSQRESREIRARRAKPKEP
jgi:hypothetical protein